MKREQLGNELPEPVRRYFLEVARMEPPSDLMDRAVAEIEATRRPNAFSAWLPAIAAVGVAAVVIVAVALNVFRFNPTPIGSDDESSSPSPAATVEASESVRPSPVPILTPPPVEGLPAAGTISARWDVGDTGAPVVAAFGSVWLANTETGRLSRFDPASGEIVATIVVVETPVQPSDLIVVADSQYVYAGQNRTVVQIDPATNEIARRFDLEGRTGPAGVYRMALDGAMLYITDLDGNAVTRLDTATGEVLSEPHLFAPGGIAVTDDGVWMVPYRDVQLSLIDPSTLQVIERHMPVWSNGMQIVADGEDSLYITGNNARPVEHFSIPDGRVVARAQELAQVALVGETLYGTHWEGALVTLDRETLEWTSYLDLGGPDTYALAAGDGYVYTMTGSELVQVVPVE